MIRIFTASSQTGTALMAHFAHKTKNKDSFDILIIDKVRKKKSLIKQVYSSLVIHRWDHIIDLSTHLDDGYDMRISKRKKITRKIKDYPIFKTVYSFLLKVLFWKRQKGIEDEILKEIKRILPEFDQNTSEIEINTLPNLYVNEALFSLGKTKAINYFEHGMGDYFDMMKLKEGTDFYCVFSDTYRDFLDKRKITSVRVHDYVNTAEFQALAEKIYEAPEAEEASIKMLKEKSCVLILLDASEMYNPPVEYWTKYIQSCIERVDDPDKYTFLIKPHGLMTQFSQNLSYEYVKQSGVKYIIFDHNSAFFNMGTEILFSVMKNKIAYVFSTFSTAVFLLAHFYPKEASYVYHYSFCKKYYQKAPANYLSLFNGLEPLINEVFAEKGSTLQDAL